MDQTGIQTWGHIPPLVEHLTRDSGGLGFNISHVSHYFSNPITFGAVPLTPGADWYTVLLPGERAQEW